MTVFHQRREYERDSLSEDSMDTNPFTQFDLWMQDAAAVPEIEEPYAMTVATVSAAGRPSARIVLLREAGENGFTFFTNYQSRKGTELRENPAIAALFYWAPLQRQVRVEGTVSLVSAEESDAYFASRPHGSQLASAASPQSSVVASREVLETSVSALERQYPDETTIPRPEHWGGYRITPDSFEFWQGRPKRLHDRIRYRRTSTDGPWIMERLAP